MKVFDPCILELNLKQIDIFDLRECPYEIVDDHVIEFVSVGMYL